jgi:hypothetical protein
LTFDAREKIMKKIFVMAAFTFIYGPLWSSNDEEPTATDLLLPSYLQVPTRSHLPFQRLVLGVSSSETSSDSDEQEDSEDLSENLRSLNALNLFVPQLENRSRAEELSLQYDLCCTIQRLQNKVSCLEDYQIRFKIFYQNQICLFQREFNKVSLSFSQTKHANNDLLKENARLQAALLALDSGSSSGDNISCETSSESSSSCDGEESVMHVKTSSEEKYDNKEDSTKNRFSTPADFGIPPLDLQSMVKVSKK